MADGYVGQHRPAEATTGATGTLLGTASLQKAIDTLSSKVTALTSEMKRGSTNSGGSGRSGSAGRGSRSGGSNGGNWNAGSNRSSTPNGGRVTGTGDDGGTGGGGNYVGQHRPPAGPVGWNNPRGGYLAGVARVGAATVGYVAAQGFKQLPERVVLGTTTSMLNRTAANGSSARSLFRNNWTGHGINDEAAAGLIAQRMGFSQGSAGSRASTTYARTAGIIDPSVDNTAAYSAMSQLRTGKTFNSLRMFGISTIGPGGKTLSPSQLAHQFIVKSFRGNNPKTKESIEASLGQTSRIGQSINAMVNQGMLDASTASQVIGAMRAELTAGVLGVNSTKFAALVANPKNIDPAGNSAASKKYAASLKAVGLEVTPAQRLLSQSAYKTNQLETNQTSFEAGLAEATKALSIFSGALTGILHGPLGDAVGWLQGLLGGGVGQTAAQNIAAGEGVKSSWVGQAAGTATNVAGSVALGLAAKKGWNLAKTRVAAVAAAPEAGKLAVGADALGWVGKAIPLLGKATSILGKLAPFAKWAPGIGIGQGGLDTGSNRGPVLDQHGRVVDTRKDYLKGPPGASESGTKSTVGKSQKTATAMKAAGTTNSSKTASNVIAIAKKYLGIPYHWGGKTPQEGFDCSGFTSFVFKQIGVNLPRIASDQQRAGTTISKKDARAGDLVFMGGSAKAGGAYHVALLIARGQIIEAAKPGTNVRIRSVNMDEVSSAARYVGALGNLSKDPVANSDGTPGQDSKSGSSGASNPISAFIDDVVNFNQVSTLKDFFAGSLGSSGGSSGPSGSGNKTTSVAATGTSGADNVTLASGNGNGAKVFNTLVQAGYSAQSAAGIVGNLMAESGVNPKSRQGGGGPGRGIMQWTENARWATLKKWAGKRDPWSLDTQVGFMLKEIDNSGISGKLKGMTNINDAVKYFHDKLERSADKTMTKRDGFANAAFKAYAQGSSYAVGSTNIDVDQTATVHRGEMIIPAHQAQGVREALAGNNPISSIAGSGGKGVQVIFNRESIKIILGTGVTSAMGTAVGRQIVDTMVKDKRLADIARGL